MLRLSSLLLSDRWLSTFLPHLPNAPFALTHFSTVQLTSPCAVLGRRRRAFALPSVRRSNCTCGFPACSFHKGAFFRDAIEGINPTRVTSPYSRYNSGFGRTFQPAQRQRLSRCDQMRRTIQRSSRLKSIRTWARLKCCPQPRSNGFNCSINSRVLSGTRRRVCWRTRSMNRRIDFSFGYAYSAPDWAPLRILREGNRSCFPHFILYPRNSNPCRTCTMRVFCALSCTPSVLRICRAASKAACASAADVQVMTQSSAYLVS